MVFDSRQLLVNDSLVTNYWPRPGLIQSIATPWFVSDPWRYFRLEFLLNISSAFFSTAKRMVGQDILCKFHVNNVIARHLWTITSPLIARGGLGIGEYRAPDFCPRRYLSFKSRVEVCLSQVLNIILLFVCHRTITYLLSIWACHIEKPLFFW